MAHTSVDVAAPGIIAPPTKEHLALLQKWTKAHVKDNNVFVLGPLSTDSVYNFDVVLFTVLELKGTVDTTTFAFHAEAFLRIPIIGNVPIGQVDGNLQDGVTMTISGIPGIASGTIRFYLQNTWDVYADIALNTIIGNFNTNGVYLFTIPH